MQGMTLNANLQRSSLFVKTWRLLTQDSPLPKFIVPVWLGLPSDQVTLEDSGIIVANFGEAFDPQVTRPFTAHTPLLIAPPESRFAEPGGADPPQFFPGDIWTLACTVWDVLDADRHLFSLIVSEPKPLHGGLHRLRMLRATGVLADARKLGRCC